MSIPEFKALDEIKTAPTTALDCALEKIARLEAENAHLKNLHHRIASLEQMNRDRDEENAQLDLDTDEFEAAFDQIINPENPRSSSCSARLTLVMSMISPSINARFVCSCSVIALLVVRQSASSRTDLPLPEIEMRTESRRLSGRFI